MNVPTDCAIGMYFRQSRNTLPAFVRLKKNVPHGLMSVVGFMMLSPPDD